MLSVIAICGVIEVARQCNCYWVVKVMSLLQTFILNYKQYLISLLLSQYFSVIYRCYCQYNNNCYESIIALQNKTLAALMYDTRLKKQSHQVCTIPMIFCMRLLLVYLLSIYFIFCNKKHMCTGV